MAAKGVKRSHGEMSVDAGKAHSNGHDGGNIVAKPKFDFDLDTLDCTICMEHFSPPVFQVQIYDTSLFQVVHKLTIFHIVCTAVILLESESCLSRTHKGLEKEKIGMVIHSMIFFQVMKLSKVTLEVVFTF